MSYLARGAGRLAAPGRAVRSAVPSRSPLALADQRLNAPDFAASPPPAVGRLGEPALAPVETFGDAPMAPAATVARPSSPAATRTVARGVGAAAPPRVPAQVVARRMDRSPAVPAPARGSAEPAPLRASAVAAPFRPRADVADALSAEASAPSGAAPDAALSGPPQADPARVTPAAPASSVAATLARAIAWSWSEAHATSASARDGAERSAPRDGAPAAPGSLAAPQPRPAAAIAPLPAPAAVTVRPAPVTRVEIGRIEVEIVPPPRPVAPTAGQRPARAAPRPPGRPARSFGWRQR